MAERISTVFLFSIMYRRRTGTCLLCKLNIDTIFHTMHVDEIPIFCKIPHRIFVVLEIFFYRKIEAYNSVFGLLTFLKELLQYEFFRLIINIFCDLKIKSISRFLFSNRNLTSDDDTVFRRYHTQFLRKRYRYMIC